MPRYDETARLTPDQYESISVRTLRAQFAALTPAQQAERRAYIQRLLSTPRSGPPSYLAQVAKDVYGVEV